jgi:hypothetical protein
MFEVTLPSGRTIAVQPPTFMDRMNAVKEFRSVQREVGYAIEELMAAKALVAVDGAPVPGDWEMEPIMRMADWSTTDTQYFIEFFMSAFFPDDKVKEAAQAAAKKLMMGETPTGPAQVKRSGKQVQN